MPLFTEEQVSFVVENCAQLKHLSVLHLTKSTMSTFGAAKMASTLNAVRKLRSLNLSSNCLQDCGLLRLQSPLRCLLSLEELNLSDNSLSSVVLPVIADLVKSSTSLEMLVLSGNPFSSPRGSSDAIAGILAQLTRLTGLHMGCVGVVDFKPCYGILQKLTGLHSLDLSLAYPWAMHPGLLHELARLTRLTALILDEHIVDWSDTARVPVHLSTWRHLRCLRACLIPAAQSMSALRQDAMSLTALTELQLAFISYCPSPSTQTADRIRAALRTSTALRRLRLTQVPASWLPALQALTQLTYLHLGLSGSLRWPMGLASEMYTVVFPPGLRSLKLDLRDVCSSADEPILHALAAATQVTSLHLKCRTLQPLCAYEEEAVESRDAMMTMLGGVRHLHLSVGAEQVVYIAKLACGLNNLEEWSLYILGWASFRADECVMLAHSLTHMPRLRSLSVSGMAFTSVELDLLAHGMQAITCLTRLEICHNPTYSDDELCTCAAKASPNSVQAGAGSAQAAVCLTCALFDRSKFSHVVSRMQNLQVLQLHACRGSVVRLSALTCLTVLELLGMRLDAKDSAVTAALLQLPQLGALVLDDAVFCGGLTVTFAKAVGSLRSLTRLSLAQCCLTEDCAKHLAACLRKLQKLHTLNLQMNKIGQRGVEMIVNAALGLDWLAHLDLTGTLTPKRLLCRITKVLTKQAGSWLEVVV